ncbi:MAG: hypothetical protein ACXVDH_00740 [Nocardioides sp.]
MDVGGGMGPASGTGALPSQNAEVIASIADRLGTEPDAFDGLGALDAGQLWQLDAAIGLALAVEEKNIESGIANALEALPWPVRGPARAILGESA